jgi:hypothetical protein
VTSYDEAIRTNQAIKTATDLYRRDARFHALAMSVAADVVNEFGPVDPENADRDVGEIAIRTAARMLAYVYTEDAEIMALKAERDTYKKLAEESLSLSPGPFHYVPK